MRPILAALAVMAATVVSPAALSAAECAGRDLIAALTPDQRAEIDTAVDATPYHQGLFWDARKDNMRITLIGTYHFGDARHQATLDQFAPLIAQANALLVEAGPEDMDRLKRAMVEDPTLIMDPTGPTLPERLEDKDWQAVSAAMSERGMPPFVASKMRPWYVAMMMSLSPCMLKQVAETGDTGGLDQILMDEAALVGTPIVALEPWDTLFSLFQDMAPDEEIDMLLSSLPAAEHADDYAATLIDAYFSEDVWRIWEFGRVDAYESSGLSRAEVDRQIDFARENMMDKRNESWIAPLTRAARQAADAAPGGQVVAGFGALHLPGERGVLRLLEKDGWQVTRIALAPSRPDASAQ